MLRFCPHACSAEDNPSDEAKLAKYREWSTLSLYDYRRYDKTHCQAGTQLKNFLSPQSRCADLENPARIKDRGWYIRRAMVHPDELDSMDRFVKSIPEPTRSMCGASGYQPRACFTRPSDLPALYPRFNGALRQLLQGWISSGFHEDASLGWPLDIHGGEFISINPWKRAESATCLVRALIIDAHTRAPVKPRRDTCLSKCSTYRYKSAMHCDCQLRCWWLDVMETPREQLAVVAKRPQCTARPDTLSFLWRFRFSETSMYAPDWVLEMHGWLTLALNHTGGFQGWHGWHQDGPSQVGRYHKAFVMVSKNRSTARGGPDATAARTNLVAVPAGARYAHNCQMGGDGGFDPEAFKCSTVMRPGDVLFFREDVFHKTQDTLTDRVSLILDIFRVPLRTTPTGTHIEKGSAVVSSARSNEEGDWSKLIKHGTNNEFAQESRGRRLGSALDDHALPRWNRARRARRPTQSAATDGEDE